MDVVFVPRAQVGYSTSLPRLGYLVEPADRTELIHHHTVIVDSDTTKNVWETRSEALANAVRLQTIRPDLGLDVPYNLVAYNMANNTVLLVEGRGMFRTGAHTAGHNTAGIGIAWAGDFHNHPAPPRLAEAVAAVEQWVANYDPKFVNLPGGQVSGHRDFKQTACPGQHLYPLIADHLPGDTMADPRITDEEAATLKEIHEALKNRGSDGWAVGFAVELVRRFRGTSPATLDESADLAALEQELRAAIAAVDVADVTEAVTAELVRRITSQ